MIQDFFREVSQDNQPFVRDDGNWIQRDELLFKKDGGHGMIFNTFDGRLLLLLHSPNKNPLERPAYFELTEKNGMLYVK